MKTHGNGTPHAVEPIHPISGRAQRQPLIHIKRPGPRSEMTSLPAGLAN